MTLAHQIKQQITWLITGGQIKAGDRLPPVRELAGFLSVNLHTVRNAYHLLEDDGLVLSRRKTGTRVQAFDPRHMAFSAANLRTHTIGVIVASLVNPFYHALLAGIASVAEENRTLMFVCATQDDPVEAWRYFLQLSARQVDGIIVASHGIDDLYHLVPAETAGQLPGLPFVSIDWPGAHGPSILLDLEGAGYQAGRHLIEHGHQRIGLVTYQQDVVNVKPLESGFFRALGESGLDTNPDLVARVGGFDTPPGREGGRHLISLRQPPTAVFAITDLLAIGVMQILKEAGLRIPQDMAVIGFNDIPLAAVIDPPLTTVAAPAFRLGSEAMRVLRSLIAGQAAPPEPIVLPTALVLRQSCGHHDLPRA